MTRDKGTKEKGGSGKTQVILLACALVFAVPAISAQSGSGQSPQQQPSSSQPAQDIPDAPSTVQPPEPRLIPAPEATPEKPKKSSSNDFGQPDQPKPAPPPMPPVETVPPGTIPATGTQSPGPKNQLDPRDDLYKISVTTNFVQIPVMVKDHSGRRVEGLLPKDFTVLENGKPQKLTYFTSDPFQLSVAVLLDLGMADVTLQKVNETYSSLVGAFSPYDEFALYTYSSTVSQVTDFTGRAARLTAALDEMKLVRGRSNGPAVLSGPLASGPTVNNLPVGGPPVAPVNTPPKEAHVLNDAILRAAIDLSKRDRTRRKVILVISDGRERGSLASYRDVLRVLETHGIQVKAVTLDTAALPLYKQIGKLHMPGQGYTNILPRYVNATGGGEANPELTRNGIEDAYGLITSDARNQYTLGYSPKAIAGGSAYRSLEVTVDKGGLNIYTKAGYYPVPAAH